MGEGTGLPESTVPGKVRMRLVVLDPWDGPDDVDTGLRCIVCDHCVYHPYITVEQERLVDGAMAICVECVPRLVAEVPPGALRRLGTG